MPEQAAQGSEQGTQEPGESIGKHVESFWKTLPGVLTACSGMIVAVTALITGLGNLGVIGPRSQVTQEAVANPPATQAPPSVTAMVSPVALESSPAGPRSPLVEFMVGQMSDGFAMVRRRPTTASEGMVKLPSGTHVKCGEPLRDVDPSLPRRWRFCPEYDGYISARLLMRAGE